MVVNTVDSTLSVTHFRAHAGIDRGLDTEVLAVLARSALSASSHLLGLSPLAAADGGNSDLLCSGYMCCESFYIITLSVIKCLFIRLFRLDKT